LASQLNRDVVVIEGGGLQINPERDAALTFETTGLPMNNLSLRRRLVGGAAALWSGRCAPLDPVDLLAKPWANHRGWPISYTELEPFFNRALSVLGLPSVTVAMDRHIGRSGNGLKLEPGMEAQLWQFVRADRSRGLHLGQHFVDVFKQKGKLLLTEADAVQLVSDGKLVTAVVCRDRSGRAITVRANEFVLACGCVEASRLLLLNQSNCAQLLAPVEKWLGRGFQQHLLINAGTVTAAFGKAFRLQALLNNFRWRSGEGYETGVRLCKNTIMTRKLLAGSACIVYETDDKFHHLNTASKLLSRMKGREILYFRPKISVELSIEQVVDQNNRITLGRQIDANGQPRASVHWSINDLELQTGIVFSDLFSKTLARNDLGHFESCADTLSLSARPRRESLHHYGGTQMSVGPSEGVVDPDLKLHGSANLSIVGGSVFPSGGHANPTLTIMALALRLAERLNSTM
jgi:choline dehydrogenase-like flavoprotein